MSEIARKSVIVEFLSDLTELAAGSKSAEQVVVNTAKNMTQKLKEVTKEAKASGEEITKAYKPLEEQTKKSTKEIEKLNEAVKAEIAAKDELIKENNRLSASIKEQTAEIGELNKALTGESSQQVQDVIKAEIGLREQNIATLQKQQAVVLQDIQATNTSIAALKEQGATVGGLRGIVEDFTNVLIPFGGQWAEVGQGINDFAEKADQAGATISNFSGKILAKAGESLKRFGDRFTPLRDAATKTSTAIAGAFSGLAARLEPVKRAVAPVGALFAVAGQKIAGAFTGAKDAIGKTITAARALPIVQKALQAGAVAARIFGVALVSTGIGAIVVAVGALVAAFASSDKGAKALKQTLEPLKFVFEAITNILGELGGKIIEAFKSPKQALIDLATLVKDNLINRFTGLAVILEGIFTLDATKLKDGLIQTTTGIENATEKAGKLKNQLQEAYRLGQQALALRDKADKLESKRAIVEAQINDVIFSRKQIAEDENKTTQERTIALQQILEQERIRILNQKQILQLQLQALELELKASKDQSGAAKKEVNDLKAEISALDLELREKEADTAKAIADLQVTYLEALNKELEKAQKKLESFKPGTQGFNDAAKEVRRLTKEVEDYNQAVQDALNPPTKEQRLERIVQEITDKLARAEPGTELFNKLAVQLKKAEGDLESYRQTVEDALNPPTEEQRLERIISETTEKLAKAKPGTLYFDELRAQLKQAERDLANYRLSVENSLNPTIAPKIDQGAIAALDREILRIQKAIEQAIIGGDDQLLNKLDRQLADVKSRLLAFKVGIGDQTAINEYVGLSREAKAATKRNLDATLKANSENIAKQADADKERRRKEAEAALEEQERLKDQLKGSVVDALGSLNEIAGQQVELYSEAVSLQQDRIARFTELAKTGSAEQLVIEEERLARLTELQERAQARQRRIAEAQLLINQAVTVSESVKAISQAFSAGGPLGIITGIAASIALATTLASTASQIGGLFGSLPKFRDGSEFIQGKGTGTSDSILARVSKGERIVPFRENMEMARIGGIPNKKLPEAVAAWHSGPVIIDAIREGNEAMISEMKQVRSELELARLDNQKTRVQILATRKGLAAMVSEVSYQDKFARR